MLQKPRYKVTIVANPQQRKSESTGDVFQNCAPVLLSSCYLLTSVSGFGIPASRIGVTSLPVLEHSCVSQSTLLACSPTMPSLNY